MPSRVSAFSNTQRMERSSSTIQTGFIACSSTRSRKRQQDPKHRVARPAVALDHSVVVLDVGLGERKPEPAAAISPGYQGTEDSLAYVLRDAGPAVDHSQF